MTHTCLKLNIATNAAWNYASTVIGRAVMQANAPLIFSRDDFDM